MRGASKRGVVHTAPPSTGLSDSYTSSKPGAHLFPNYSAGETLATSNSYLKNKGRNRRADHGIISNDADGQWRNHAPSVGVYTASLPVLS